MERELSEVFCINGKQVRVEKGICHDCYLLHDMCFLEPIMNITGRCSYREDKQNVCFKLIGKDGDKKTR